MSAPTLPGTGARSPLLDGLRAELGKVIDDVEAGALTRLAEDDLIVFVQEFETLRNLQARVDHQIMVACERAQLSTTWSRLSSHGLIAEVTRISGPEAKRRATHAACLTGRTTPTGAPVPPEYLDLAAVAATGRPSAEVVDIAVRCLNTLKARYHATQEQLDWAETELCRHAVAFGPTEYRQIARSITDALYPDGLLDDHQVKQSRELHLTRKGDGSYRIEGRLTGTCGAAWSAILSPLAKPRPADAAGKDTRTAGQRMHDGFEDAARRLLKAGGLPDSGGTTCSIIAVVSLADLYAKTGMAYTTDGQQISVSELYKLIDEADIYPTLFDHDGTPLVVGRKRRTANRRQTIALIARDGGCSFPGCDRPPEWCDRHHIRDWCDYGPSDIINFTLLCGFHHDKHVETGWTCTINTDGLPEWIPPPWIDPDQQPLINTRILHRHQALFNPHPDHPPPTEDPPTDDQDPAP